VEITAVNVSYHYRVYGLSLDSPLPLPELTPREKAAEGNTVACDVQVLAGKVPPVPSDAQVVGIGVWTRDGDVWIDYVGVVKYFVHDGQKIIVEPEPEVEARVIRLYLLNVCLAVILHQRGFLALHAGAVAMKGGVVGFLGYTGMGKSTVTAALHSQGHALISDDVVAIDMNDPQGPWVYSGFGQLKLFPEVAEALGHNTQWMPLLHPELTKVGHRVAELFGQRPLRLATLYVLADGDEVTIDTLKPQEALVELIRHSYAIRLADLVDPSAHFRQCAALISLVRISRLTRPRDLTQLAVVASLVEQDNCTGEAQ